MNTVGDILKLVSVVSDCWLRSGIGMIEKYTRPFQDCVGELVAIAYFELCVPEEAGRTMTRKDLPDLNSMNLALGALDQSTHLRKMAQGRYYATVAWFLTAGTEEWGEHDQIALWSRSDMLIQAGLLPFGC